MARSPRAGVPKTSGQGVSRLSYQQGYKLGNRGKGSDLRYKEEDKPAKQREYAKSGKSGLGDMNVSYGETLPIGEISDVEALAKSPVPKSSAKVSSGKPKVIK